MKSFIVNTSLRLQSRSITIPWLERVYSSSATTVRCVQSDSNVPVSLGSLRRKKINEVVTNDSDLKRPKGVRQNASETRMPKIGNLQKEKTKEASNVSVLKRQKSVCGIYSEKNVTETTSSKKKEINKNDLQRAEQVAIELLAGRAFSIAELRKKLLAKKFPSIVVDRVIADLKTRGLVNDGLYAEAYSRSRWLSATWGPRRIKQALIQKGVSIAEVNKATEKIFELDDEEEDEKEKDNVQEDTSRYNNTEQTMSQSSMDRLFVQASKQWLKGGQDLSTESRKTRLVRWLQYRGFNWNVISVILEKLQSEYRTDNDTSTGTDIGTRGTVPKREKNLPTSTGTRGGASKKEDLSDDDMDKLFVEVSKQWMKGKDVSFQNQKARTVRWLQYRGHNWGVIADMLERLQSKSAPLS